MYLETRSTVEDGELVELRKLKIEGTEDELKSLAMTLMDAVDNGKAKRQIEATKLVVKLLAD